MLQTEMELRKMADDFLELKLFVVLRDSEGDVQTLVAETLAEFDNEQDARDMVSYYQRNGVNVGWVEYETYWG